MYDFSTRKLAHAERARTEIGPAERRSHRLQQRAKRTLDIWGAILLTLFLAPLLLTTAAAIKLSSRGPVIFTQLRTGAGGRPFRILKFRTMQVMEDGDEVVQVTRNDARLTAIGRFLRRTSIDELPQLINVIRGDMSLVGPRPHAVAHDEAFAALAPDYHLRFRVRPGITGLAQVSGHRGEIASKEQIIARVQCDNAYIDDWSLASDLVILVRTALGLPFHKAF